MYFQAYTIGKKLKKKKRKKKGGDGEKAPPSVKEKRPRKAEESAKCLTPWQAGREWAALEMV